jgi:phage shock protein PspC (stress-responsive transcriptional regulator)
MSNSYRKLYRDTEDQKIGGVCSGLARYFDLDPLLVRVAFVALTLMAGGAFIAYLLLWWLVDPAPADHWAESPGDAPSGEFAPPTTKAA